MDDRVQSLYSVRKSKLKTDGYADFLSLKTVKFTASKARLITTSKMCLFTSHSPSS